MTSWLQKLGLGLKKSSSRLSSGISDILTKRKIDDATLEELEELLITSDMGVKASSKIVDTAFLAYALTRAVNPRRFELALPTSSVIF